MSARLLHRSSPTGHNYYVLGPSGLVLNNWETIMDYKERFNRACEKTYRHSAALATLSYFMGGSDDQHIAFVGFDPAEDTLPLRWHKVKV